MVMIQDIAEAVFSLNGRALCLVMLLLAAVAPARADGLPALEEMQADGADVSALVVDLGRGTVLASLAPQKSLIPASIMKVPTSALALENWGPRYQFTTIVSRRGPLQGDRLNGDLVLVGAGDPHLTDEELWRLARDVAQTGLKRVTGDLVVNAGLFGKVPCNTPDRCNAVTRSGNAYDAALSSAAVDFGSITLTIRAAEAPGRPPAVEGQPYDVPSVSVDNAATTSRRPDRLSVLRVTEGGQDRLVVRGGLSDSQSPVESYRSLGEPERHSGELFRAFLAREGVRVDGGIRVDYQPAGSDLEVLVARPGRLLVESLNRMLAYSNNFMADVLVLGLGASRGLQPPIAPVQAGALLQTYVRAIADGGRFKPPGVSSGAVIRDGSGLDTGDRLAAWEMVALLDYIFARPELFPALYGSLVIPYHGPGSSLRRAGDTPWRTRIAVKTGGLTEPVSVTTLAGYFRLPDGGFGAFAFLVNGRPGQRVWRRDAFAAMEDDLTALWSRFPAR